MKNKSENFRNKVIISIFVFFSIIALGAIINFYKHIEDEKELEEKTVMEEVNIFATGDIMYHMITYINNFNQDTGKYEFDTFYSQIEEYFKESDLVVGNYETTVNPNRKYSGFPCFNTPQESIEYLKNVGFDVLSTANNHCIDTGIEGIISTIDAMDKYGIKHFGTYKENIRKGIIIEKNNIKIGFLGYSENFNGMDALVPKDKQFMISKMDNVDKIREDIADLKKRGADFIIVYPHWGVEYSIKPNDFQKFMNEEMLLAGADVVLGSHPHVLQRAERRIIKGEEKFTIYSMGNSISNQRREYIKNLNTETGVFVNLKIQKKSNEEKAHLKSVDLLPTYVRRYKEDGKSQYQVVLIKDYIEGGKYRYTIDDTEKKRIDENYERALNILYSVGD